MKQRSLQVVALCVAWVVGHNYRDCEGRTILHKKIIVKMIMDFLSGFHGLSVMDCLWNVWWTAWNGFQLSLIGFPQPFVCVWAGRASYGVLLPVLLLGIYYSCDYRLCGSFLDYCYGDCLRALSPSSRTGSGWNRSWKELILFFVMPWKRQKFEDELSIWLHVP